jgi:hypothetical protein
MRSTSVRSVGKVVFENVQTNLHTHPYKQTLLMMKIFLNGIEIKRKINFNAQRLSFVKLPSHESFHHFTFFRVQWFEEQEKQKRTEKGIFGTHVAGADKYKNNFLSFFWRRRLANAETSGESLLLQFKEIFERHEVKKKVAGKTRMCFIEVLR